MVRLDAASPGAIEQAARVVADGGLLAFPTETVYGLGARADDDAAVVRIFHAKGRPSEHPLIVHVASLAQVASFAAQVPPAARRLMDAFWPGPLTLILPRRDGIATAAAGGQSSIGVRAPRHPVARALLDACAGLGVAGVAAPSANRFGRLSPTRAAHVLDEGFTADVRLLDGGACDVGIESTIVDFTRADVVILRPGVIEAVELSDAAGVPVLTASSRPASDAPRASGTLPSHYAPRARLRLMRHADLRTALALAGDELAQVSPPRVAVYARTLAVPRGIMHRRMPASARAAAFDLFAALRELDASGVPLIWVEAPPDDDPAWDGVRDRLTRAAA